MTIGQVGAHRVGLLGYGAIGRAVAGPLRAGAVPGAELVAVATRSGAGSPEATDMAGLIGRSQLVVEAAGHLAVRTHAPEILDAGLDLLLVSVGALADEGLRKELDTAGPGRLTLSSGAIGGLDLLRSARQAGPVAVELVSTKRPTALVQPWMDPEQVAALHAAAEGGAPVVVFEGGAAEAARRFPANANVAATLALAAGDWAAVRVRLVGDGAADTTHHEITVVGVTGSYRLSIRNVPLPANTASSRLVAGAVIREVADRAANNGPRFS